MKTELRTIDQTGMRALIMERLERPELYADKPLFVWQGVWSDGVQQEVLLHACRDFNRGKDREDWSVFRMTTVGDGENHLNRPDSTFVGRVAGYLIHTRTLSLEHYLREVGKLIEENNSSLPLIVYLPYRYEQRGVDDTCFNAEHCIFAPDFETWAKTWQDSTIPDFIRGDGDKAGITYRWYNLFNDPHKGCSTPDVWFAVSSFLNGFIELTKNYRQNYGISDLGEGLICAAFKAGMNASGGHISDDVVDEFLKHVKSTQLITPLHSMN